jgi:hypothetical protein
MMQAELHGHAAREIVANEDYLTSTGVELVGDRRDVGIAGCVE